MERLAGAKEDFAGNAGPEWTVAADELVFDDGGGEAGGDDAGGCDSRCPALKC